MKKLARTVPGLCFLTILLWPAHAYAVPVPWSDCGSSSDILQVQQADASIWPPVRGQQITLTTKGTVSQTIAAMSGSFTLSYIRQSAPPLHLFSTSWNAIPVGPIPAGPFTLTKTFWVPPFLPAGPYTAQLEEYTPSQQRIFCIDVTVPFK